MEYVEFKYRERMGYTPEEMDRIPTQIIERDFLFIQREGMAQKALKEG